MKRIDKKKMEDNVKLATPKYQQIAVDLAAKIVNQHYKIGDKVYTRSNLSSQYGVSSETARRAINMLSDMDIVLVSKGSGVVIQSYENAVKFIQQFQGIQTLHDLKSSIIDAADKQIEESQKIKEKVIGLVERIEHLRSINPFVPFEIQIEKKTPMLNKTASEVNFWHNTAATIIAIKRGDEMFLSPGPYAMFCDQDVVYFVGDESTYERVKNFFYPSNY